MINKNNRINPDELKITDHAVPNFKAGTYKLHVKQKVQLIDNDFAEYETQETSFEVAAPRFSLDPLIVYSEYPKAGATGAYADTLPNVVFKRKTLPWERSITEHADTDTPWVCLLLFEEDELKDHNIVLQNLLMQEIYADKANIIRPVFEKEASDNVEMGKPVTSETPRYHVIDVPCPLLDEVIPRIDELKYLAHCRQVDTSDKEKSEGNLKGWYSVLVANRLPAQDKNHVAFVVSLEGHQAILNGNTLTDVENSDKLARLIVLYSWEFISKGETFQQLVQHIDAAASPLKMDVDNQKISDANISKAFNYGYTALNYHMRNGADNISWYRGPLVPVQISKPEQVNFKDADAALLFDESTAMFDISYSSAWQIGRLLGLQAPAYMSALTNWKKNIEADIRLLIAKSFLKKEFEDTFSFEDTQANDANDKKLFSEAVNTAESDDFLNSLLGELWATKINNHG